MVFLDNVILVKKWQRTSEPIFNAFVDQFNSLCHIFSKCRNSRGECIMRTKVKIENLSACRGGLLSVLLYI